MRAAQLTRKLILPGLATLAAGVLTAAAASAQPTLVYNAGLPTEYATQAIGATTLVTLPSSLVLTSIPVSTGTTITSEAITFTLPGSATWVTTPTVTCTPPALATTFTCTPSISGGTLTVTTSYTNSSGANQIFVMSLAGAAGTPWNTTNFSALSVPVPVTGVCTVPGALQITESSSDTNFNGTPAAPLKTGFACSESALQFTTQAPSTAGFATLVIDVTSPSLAEQFNPTSATEVRIFEKSRFILAQSLEV